MIPPTTAHDTKGTWRDKKKKVENRKQEKNQAVSDNKLPILVRPGIKIYSWQGRLVFPTRNTQTSCIDRCIPGTWYHKGYRCTRSWCQMSDARGYTTLTGNVRKVWVFILILKRALRNVPDGEALSNLAGLFDTAEGKSDDINWPLRTESTSTPLPGGGWMMIS